MEPSEQFEKHAYFNNLLTDYAKRSRTTLEIFNTFKPNTQTYRKFQLLSVFELAD